ncbi:MAG: thioredoxin [Candidatus Roizmanbacteria bacterium]|nr:thioredoxin [Candidatus Roizmanbacteria bacterium]
MKQTILTFAIMLVIVGLLAVVAIGSRDRKTDIQTTQSHKATSSPIALSPTNQAPIFFYGETCPHCKDVEEWMKENKVEKKISIVKKEVYENRDNAQELTQVAGKCNLPTDTIGVPFLYAEGKCFVGSPDVISYFSSKMEIDSTERNNR